MSSINTQRAIRFVSHFPTHSTVWEMMEHFPEGNCYTQRLIDSGEVFIDRYGTYWHAHCAFFTTENGAMDYAGKAGASYWLSIEIITLTANPVRG